VEEFKLIEFKVLVGGIPFLLDRILVFRKFVGDYHVRSTPPTTQILSYSCLLIPLLLVE